MWVFFFLKKLIFLFFWTDKGSNPTWDQTFTFHLQEGTTNLLLKVMDEDRFTRDDELGLVTFVS